jgi:hypothetical protein
MRGLAYHGWLIGRYGFVSFACIRHYSNDAIYIEPMKSR